MTTAALDTVALSDNLYWDDEFAWSPVAQQSTRALDGTLIVEERARDKGRPITLRGAWLDRATIEQLKTLEQEVGQTHTLTLPTGDTHQVVFRRERERTAIQAEPLYALADPDADTLYQVTIRLTEV